MQDGGTLDFALLQRLQGAVCLLKFEDFDICSQASLYSKRKELAAIVAGTVGNTTDHTFPVEQGVIHLRDRAHGNSGERQGAAFPQAAESYRNKRACGGENDGGVKLARRHFLACANPRSA